MGQAGGQVQAYVSKCGGFQYGRRYQRDFPKSHCRKIRVGITQEIATGTSIGEWLSDYIKASWQPESQPHQEKEGGGLSLH